MSGTGAPSDPTYSTELGQTESLAGQHIAPAVPSQMVADHWYTPSLVNHDPTTHPNVEGEVPPPNIPFDFHILRGVPSFDFESLFSPTLRSQLGLEETAHVYETGPETDQRATSLSYAIDPHLLVNYSSTTSAAPGAMVQQPRAHPADVPPFPIRGSSTDSSTDYTGDVHRFVGVVSQHKYECLWDDGPGNICGYSGTLLGVKRHHRRAHPLNRSIFCSICGKALASTYSLRLHSNIHTGEDPYQCQDCEKGFKSPNARRYHRIHHHGYTPKKKRQGGM